MDQQEAMITYQRFRSKRDQSSHRVVGKLEYQECKESIDLDDYAEGRESPVSRERTLYNVNIPDSSC
jgi:hypothetical protein